MTVGSVSRTRIELTCDIEGEPSANRIATLTIRNLGDTPVEIRSIGEKFVGEATLLNRHPRRAELERGITINLRRFEDLINGRLIYASKQMVQERANLIYEHLEEHYKLKAHTGIEMLASLRLALFMPAIRETVTENLRRQLANLRMPIGDIDAARRALSRADSIANLTREDKLILQTIFEELEGQAHALAQLRRERIVIPPNGTHLEKLALKVRPAWLTKQEYVASFDVACVVIGAEEEVAERISKQISAQPSEVALAAMSALFAFGGAVLRAAIADADSSLIAAVSDPTELVLAAFIGFIAYVFLEQLGMLSGYYQRSGWRAAALTGFLSGIFTNDVLGLVKGLLKL